MPDPIDELENFSIPGPAMNPMPASEVRRRGDRIRRRNNVLTAAGGIAAVAVIAAPFAVFGGGSSSPDKIAPAPQPTEWVQEIPQDFPLTDQMPASTKERDGYEQQHVDVCEDQSWSAEGVADVRQATYTDPSEGGSDRVLGVYPSEREATLALESTAARVQACALETEDARQRSVDVLPSAIGDASVVYTNHMSDAGDMFVVQLVQVGNAILQDSTYSFGGGDPQVVQQMADLLETTSAGVVDSMCLFSADGCGDDGDGDDAADPAIGEGAVPAIPEGFPLDAGLPTGSTMDEVPSPEPSACDESVAVPDTAVETAHAQWRDLSQIQDHQLMTFATQAEAQAYVDSVVGVFCVDDDKGGGASRVTRVYPVDLGDYAMGAVGHNEVDGEVDPGLVLTQVVRVGRAVLIAQRIDEGYTWTGDVDQQSGVLVSDGFSGLGPAVDAMCTFTEQGC
jgi:hypothetical protein